MTAPPHAPTRRHRWSRAAFVRFVPMPTRWDDNDVFGHVNNVRYYAFFDTAITRVEMESGLFSIDGPVIPYVVDSSCTYFEAVAFPDELDVGVAVERIGTSSIAYRLGVFRQGAEAPAAQGHFVHVYVDRQTGRPSPMSEAVRAFAASLRPGAPQAGPAAGG